MATSRVPDSSDDEMYDGDESNKQFFDEGSEGSDFEIEDMDTSDDDQPLANLLVGSTIVTDMGENDSEDFESDDNQPIAHLMRVDRVGHISDSGSDHSESDDADDQCLTICL